MKVALFNLSRYLNENQLMPLDSSCCRFCHSEDQIPVAQIQTNPEVLLMECRNCYLVFVSRLPKREVLENFYSGKFYNSFTASVFQKPKSSGLFHKEICFDNPKRFARHFISRVIKNLNKPSINILDFGGGNGSNSLEIAKLLRKKGIEKVNITVVDWSKERLCANTYISLTYKTTLDSLLEKNNDFVIASASLEHIPELRETLIQLLKSLFPAGVFYARTPYVVPWCKLLRIIKMEWDFYYPAHLYDMGQRFWDNCLKILSLEDDFEIIESRPSIPEVSLKYIIGLLSYAAKLPWYLFRNHYKLVGGWEVFIRRKKQ